MLPKATIKCLKGLGFKDEMLMVWPSNSPDINPIENLWAIISKGFMLMGSSFPRYTSYGKLLN